MTIFKIKNTELIDDVVGNVDEFPKYTTQIINLANQNAQGTRARVVGQVSDLIQEFTGNNYNEWEEWYQSKKPTSIENATDKVYDMVIKLQQAMNCIDKDLIRKWVKDLVLTKTYIGLRFQKSILMRIAILKNCSYRLATAEEESRGIDGYIENLPVSIKPLTYKLKNMLSEQIEAKMVYYEKVKDGIKVTYDF